MGHPADHYHHIELVAMDDSEVSVLDWREAELDVTLAARLGRCMTQLNAWSTIRLRPQLADRVQGILTLAARRFGQERNGWWDLRDVRMTHQQLSAATGAARPTVTKVMRDMERNGIISYSGHGVDRTTYLRAYSAAGEPPETAADDGG